VGDSSSIQRLRDWWRPLHSSDLTAAPHSLTTFLAIDKNPGTDRRRLRVELSATGRQPLDVRLVLPRANSTNRSYQFLPEAASGVTQPQALRIYQKVCCRDAVPCAHQRLAC
jgi:hypothetical protein